MSKMSSKIKWVKCQGFSHIFINCTSKSLVIQEYKYISKEKDYNNQVYKPNLKNFSNLDKEDVQEKRFNTIRSNESKMKVNKEYGVSVLVIEKNLGDPLMKSSEAVIVVLEYFLDIYPSKLPNTLSLMLENHNIIDFKRHVELPNLVPHTRDEKNEYNLKLLGCVQTISTQVLNSVCLISYP